MTGSMTTSIRLSQEVRQQLNQASQFLHRGKNWIINEALKKYLLSLNQLSLASEARRQSLLSSKTRNEEEEKIWEDNIDTTDWKY